MPCEEYLELEKLDALQEKLHDSIVGWAYGYWSGMNIAINSDETKPSIEKDLFDQTVEPDALTSRLKARCLENRTESVVGIIAEIYWELPELE